MIVVCLKKICVPDLGGWTGGMWTCAVAKYLQTSFCVIGPPSYGMDLGVSPSKRVCDGPSNSTCTSLEGPCETAHLNFDDVDYINIEHNLSHATNSTSSTISSSVSSMSPMMTNDSHRIAFPSYRSRFTPPRSPLAGPAISQTHNDNPVTIVTTQSCFTFAPVRDWQEYSKYGMVFTMVERNVSWKYCKSLCRSPCFMFTCTC